MADDSRRDLRNSVVRLKQIPRVSQYGGDFYWQVLL